MAAGAADGLVRARGRRRGGFLVARLAAAVVVLATGLGSVSPPAKAQGVDGQVLTAGQVVSFDDPAPGVEMQIPRDGRLAGYGFEATITGVAFADRAGVGTDTPVVAGPGAQLVVISINETDVDQSWLFNYDNTNDPAFAVRFGPRTVSLPYNGSLTGSSWEVWAVAIPTGSPALFSASGAGFTQTFDLRAGRRVGVSPTALYRSWAGPEVRENLTATQTLTATGSAADPVSFVIAPDLADLVYFKPGSTITPPPAPDRAWLVVEMDPNSTITDANGQPLSFGGQLIAPNVVLETPTGAVDPISFQLNPDSTNLLSGVYAFPVPATFTTGTLTIAPYGTVQADDNGQTVTISFPQETARVTINLPIVPPLPPGGYRSSAGATRPGAAAAVRSTGGSGSPVGLIIGLLIGALALAALAVWWLIRRRTLPVIPVGRVPSALLPGPPPVVVDLAGVALEVGAHRTLPAGPSPAALGDGDPVAPGGEAPATPDATAESDRSGPVVVVSVLGALRVDGLRAPIRRTAVRRLLVALALTQDRAVSGEELRDLGATDPDQPLSLNDVYSHASKLRSSLPADALPSIGGGDGGYRLADTVDVDWTVSRSWPARPRRPRDPTGSSSACGPSPWSGTGSSITARGRGSRRSSARSRPTSRPSPPTPPATPSPSATPARPRPRSPVGCGPGPPRRPCGSSA